MLREYVGPMRARQYPIKLRALTTDASNGSAKLNVRKVAHAAPNDSARKHHRDDPVKLVMKTVLTDSSCYVIVNIDLNYFIVLQ